jgi:hypothetical protein
MDNKKFSIGFVILTMFMLLSYSSNAQKNYNTCLSRLNTSWGEATEKCTYSKDIFKAEYQNTCNEAVDVAIALQRTDKKWDCFYYENIKPNEKVKVFVCKGTGKSLKWVRKAGDKETTFPTKEEINQMYKK